MSVATVVPPSSVSTVLDMEDLFIEIIVRVPRILLVRLQLVSKRWQSLIYTGLRLRLRLRHTKNPPSFIISPSLWYSVGDFLYFSPPHQTHLVWFRFESPSTKILASHNGLMLLHHYMDGIYTIYNPTTGKSRHLPFMPLWEIDGSATVKFYLVYEPTQSPHYSVIRQGKSLHIYESKSHDWTEIEFEVEGYRLLTGGICCNDKLYWITPQNTTYCSYFDLKRRRFGRYPSIHVVDDDPFTCYQHDLFESGGRVHCVRNYGIEEEKCFDIFLLSEDDSNWSKIGRVSLDRSMWYDYRVIGMWYKERTPSDYMFNSIWPVSIVTGEEESKAILINIYGEIISFTISGGGGGGGEPGSWSWILDMRFQCKRWVDKLVDQSLFGAIHVHKFVENWNPV